MSERIEQHLPSCHLIVISHRTKATLGGGEKYMKDEMKSFKEVLKDSTRSDLLYYRIRVAYLYKELNRLDFDNVRKN